MHTDLVLAESPTSFYNLYFYHSTKLSPVTIRLTDPGRCYQPKATTLACVLVRMAALVLILEYPSLNYFPFLMLSKSIKQPLFNEYLTPYAWSKYNRLRPFHKCKATNI